MEDETNIEEIISQTQALLNLRDVNNALTLLESLPEEQQSSELVQTFKAVCLLELDREKSLHMLENILNNLKEPINHKLATYLIPLCALHSKHSDSIRLSDSLLKKDPKNIFALKSKQNSLIESKQYEESLNASQTFVRLYPNNFDALLSRATSFHYLLRFEEAIEDYQRALSIHQKPLAFADLSTCLMALDRNQEAKDAAKMCLELDRNSFEGHTKLFECHLKLQSFDEAIVESDWLINNGNQVDKEWFLGWKVWCLHHVRRFKEALDASKQILQINPINDTALHNAGLALIELEDYNSALEHINRAIEVKEVSAYLISKAIVLNYLGRFQEGLPVINRAIELDPNHSESYSTKALLLQELGRYDEAIDSNNSALMLNENNIEAIHNTGICMMILGRFDEAEKNFHLCLKINENFVNSIVGVSECHVANNQLESALDWINRAISVDPNYARSYMIKGMIAFRLGQPDSADEYFAQAIELNPLLTPTIEKLKKDLQIFSDFTPISMHNINSSDNNNNNINSNQSIENINDDLLVSKSKKQSKSTKKTKKTDLIPNNQRKKLSTFVTSNQFECDFRNVFSNRSFFIRSIDLGFDSNFKPIHSMLALRTQNQPTNSQPIQLLRNRLIRSSQLVVSRWRLGLVGVCFGIGWLFGRNKK